MSKSKEHEKINEKRELISKKSENWLDELMERQKEDLKAEEVILSIVPNRIKHKYLQAEQ